MFFKINILLLSLLLSVSSLAGVDRYDRVCSELEKESRFSKQQLKIAKSSVEETEKLYSFLNKINNASEISAVIATLAASGASAGAAITAPALVAGYGLSAVAVIATQVTALASIIATSFIELEISIDAYRELKRTFVKGYDEKELAEQTRKVLSSINRPLEKYNKLLQTLEKQRLGIDKNWSWVENMFSFGEIAEKSVQQMYENALLKRAVIESKLLFLERQKTELYCEYL